MGDHDSAQFYVKCFVNGVLEDFHVDTGSTFSALTYNDKTSNLNLIGSSQHTSASGKIKNSDKVVIDNFSLGNLDLKNWGFIRYPEGLAKVNLLGMDILSQNKVLKFDFQSWTLETNETSLFIDKDKKIQKYIKNIFGIKLDIAGETLNALWDTGAELSVIDKNFITNNQQAFKFIKKIDGGRDGTGESIEFDLYQTQFILNGITIDETIMSMDFNAIHEKIDPSLSMIVGTNIMQKRIWTFDFINNLWNVC